MSKTQKNRNNFMKANYFLEFTFDVNVNMDVSFTDCLEDTGCCGHSVT